jgi:hypothetical protein
MVEMQQERSVVRVKAVRRLVAIEQRWAAVDNEQHDPFWLGAHLFSFASS